MDKEKESFLKEIVVIIRRKERNLHFKILTDYTLSFHRWKRKEQWCCLGKTPQNTISGQKGLKEAWKLWRVKDNLDKTQKEKERPPYIRDLRSAAESSMLVLEGTASKARLKSTYNFSGNVTVTPIARVKGCYCSQRCLLNSRKCLSQLNVSLNHSSLFPQNENRSSHLLYQRDPSGPLRVILPHWSLCQSWRTGANSFLETGPKHKPQHIQYWKVSKLRIKPQSFWCT